MLLQNQLQTTVQEVALDYVLTRVQVLAKMNAKGVAKEIALVVVKFHAQLHVPNNALVDVALLVQMVAVLLVGTIVVIYAKMTA